MTREEAIVHIKDIICENNTIKPNIVVFEQEKEALYMAIKALEQEPFDIETYCKEHFCVMVDKDVWEKAEKAMKQEPCEDIAKAFQFGMALGFGEKHDEMDKVIDEIKKVITPQPKTVCCKECKYFEYCKRWGDGCKTKEDDYCFMFEPQESEEKYDTDK